MQIRSLCKQKMKSEGGASLAVALLFFIVCAVVGSIIIAAAMSSAGRMSGIESGQNKQYMLQSAKDLIIASMLSDGKEPVASTDADAANDVAKMIYRNTSGKDSDSPETGEYPKANVGGTTYEPISFTQIENLKQLGLVMANDIYSSPAVWKSAEASWPDEAAADSGQTNGSDGAASGSQASGTQQWRPEKGLAQKSVTLSLKPKPKTAKQEADAEETGQESGSESSGQESSELPVYATLTMRSDFSILVNLSTEENDAASTQSLEFVLVPTIEMNYESIIEGEGEAGQNVRYITCRISWQSVGTDESVGSDME